GGVPVDPRRGDGGASRPRAGDDRDRRAVPAHRRVSCLHRIRRLRATIIAKGRRGRRRRRRAAMNETTLSPRALRIAAPALLALVVVALWQLLTDLYSVPSYLVPSPTVVAKTLVDDRELLLRSLSVTLGVALTALLVATVLGTLAALVFVQSRWIEMSLFPYA